MKIDERPEHSRVARQVRNELAWLDDGRSLGGGSLRDRHCDEAATAALVYVSTYGKAHDRYYYACEEPRGIAPEEYETIDRGEDVDFKTLMKAIEKHLA